MANKNSKYEFNENGQLERKGVFAWFGNFFYYYKSYVIAAAVIIGFVAVLYFSMSRTRADIHIKTVSNFEITQEEMTPFYENLDAYLKDIDKDGVKYMQTENIYLVEEPQNQNERDQYKLLEDALNNNEVACFIVDDFAYEYLMKDNKLRELSFFGIESDEQYRIKLNGMDVFNGVEIEENMYFVMKYIPDDEYEDYFTSLMASQVVDIMNSVINDEQ